jgi:purine-binding chemotaxis protein CheW
VDTQTRHSEQGQYLGFYLAGEEYGVDILRVKEILQYDTVTSVPTTPASIRGVINLRGSVVPVVDLAVKFGLPASAITKQSCIVVVEVDIEGEQTVMGILADSVSQVIDLPAGEIQPPPPFGIRVRVECLIGMGKAGKKFVLLLDIDKVLSTADLLAAVDEAVAKGGGALAEGVVVPAEAGEAASAGSPAA